MILDIDVGNSRIKWRIFGRGGVRRGTIESSKALTSREWPELRPDRVRVSSVASRSQTLELGRWLHSRFGCTPEFAQTTRSAAGLVCGYDEPARLGVDRWLAMVAAKRLAAAPVVVIDLGTAATVDFVLAGGTHKGGFIVPGLRLMTAALLHGTADVRVTFDISNDDLRPGTNTESAVRNGVVLMIADFATRSIARFGSECTVVPRVYVCGGDAAIVAPHINAALEIEDELVLDGLGLILP